MKFMFASCWSWFLTSAIASTLPARESSENELAVRSSCQNTATSRGCWGDHNISTNWYDEVFHTGVVREYWLEVVNVTLAPDGYSRQTLSFNGTIPGPTITADWGDDLVIHVTNKLKDNGTSVHWHGMRQLSNSEFDGVPGVTQCPIAPGDTLTYQLHASSYGTTWYHSHFSLQYGDGLLGPLVINGPSSANYDEDLGTIFLSDWDHKTIFENWQTTKSGFGPEMSNVLLNFQNVYDCTDSTDPACLGTGTRFEVNFVKGTKYKIRLLNTAVDGWFQFSMDNHTFQVIATDLVPIVPFYTDSLMITVGQRYDIIVEANATEGDYWMRAGWQNTCATNYAYDNGLGIIRYNNSSTAEPTSVSPGFADSCADADYSLFTPYVPITVGAASYQNEADVGYSYPGLFFWTINNSSLYLNWSDPTTLKAYKNESIFPTDYNVYPLTVVDEWVYWVIVDDTGFMVVHHPIHLHGHDFFVLAQETGEFSENTVLNLDNPLRRDTASLPGGGFLVLAFKTDNPGSWLMHCHIAWHVSEGFAMQFVEREGEIAGTLTQPNEFLDTCSTWDSYYPTNLYSQDDSGV